MSERLSDMAQKFRKSIPIRLDLCLLFIIAFGVRIIVVCLSISQIGREGIMNIAPDGILYMNMARDILAGTNQFEHGFFTFGPGFAYYLAFFFGLFGPDLIPFVFNQIFISCLSCLFIYKLGMMLTKSYPISMIAGFLAALSLTSIMLSAIVLSDTIYLFLFVLSLVLYVWGLEQGSWWYFLGAGVLTGIAALFRSIGQFWPLVMVIIAIPYMKESSLFGVKFRSMRRRLCLKVGVAVVIAAAIIFAWMARNQAVHGIPVLASTTANQVIGLTLEKMGESKPAEIWQEWFTQYKTEHNLDSISMEDMYRLSRQKARQFIRQHTGMMMKAYLSLIWENLNDIDYIHRALLPEFKAATIGWEYKIKGLYLNYASFVLSMIGLLILLVTRRYKAFVVLGSVYVYYALMIGFGRWQGSRLFLPGQVAWTILIGVVLVYVYRIRALLKKKGEV
jgi:4-amino-4-deoxy-L-arabinose transferase-like glycosyltransferase